MTFTLTREYLETIADAAAKGDIGPFLDSIDPDVKWRLGSSEEKGTGKEGVYNRAEFMNHFLSKIPVIFPNGIKVESISLEIVGNKAIAENKVTGISDKFGPYLNYVCVVSEYSAETGKAVSIREYLDTNKAFAMMAAHGF